MPRFRIHGSTANDGDGAKTVDEHVNLIPSDLRARMLEHGTQSASGAEHDPHPVVRLFVEDGTASWLLADLDPDDPDLAWGLCDEGLGVPRLDYVRLSDLAQLFGGDMQRDADFVARQSLNGYLDDAKRAGSIQL